MINMKIAKTLEGSRLLIALEGRLDTSTAPQLETELKASVNGITMLEFDFAALEYLSSAGLRVILMAQKIMNKQGKMVIRHVNETIMEVFEITGSWISSPLRIPEWTEGPLSEPRGERLPFQCAGTGTALL